MIKKKFDIVCHDETEWNNLQLFLFKKGYHWEGFGDETEIHDFGWSYPRILKNYRTGDFFGSQILIIDSYEYLMKKRNHYPNIKNNIKLVNYTSFIRKEKLKKI